MTKPASTHIKTLTLSSREAWRAWLEKSHATAKEVWLVYYKKHTGKPTISYVDAVEEALCFGWIDSVVRRLDEEKYIQKYTPRKAGSNWSDLNKKRVAKLIKQGLMTEAGIEKIEEAKRNGSWMTLDKVDKVEVPVDLKKALSLDPKAKENFEKFAPSAKKLFLWWIASAKREETRKKRIDETVRRAAQNKRMGM